jgi:hypothetical protein
MMETASTSEMSVNFYQTTPRYKPWGILATVRTSNLNYHFRSESGESTG